MEIVFSIISSVDSWIWGIPMIVLLIGCHLFSTIRTGFIQLKLPQAIKLSFTNDKDAEGDISQFGALCTALSGTLGVGCIIGVATAIMSGGPGAVFWMWITGILGIATKYCETYIAVKYRVKDNAGQMCGGAMYVWEYAFKRKASNKNGEKIKTGQNSNINVNNEDNNASIRNNKYVGKTPWWAKLAAILFAVFTAVATLGTGSSVQASAISESVIRYFPEIPQWVVALAICGITSLVIFGGVKKISIICEKLVPFMTIAYLIGTLILLIINWNYIIPAIALILKSAFLPEAAFGGAVGSGFLVALQFGMARGLFSNESGLGTAPIVAAAAATKNPARQSLVAMTGAFWSTVVICLFTGIALVSSMIAHPELLSSDAQILTLRAFEQIPYIGGPVLGISLIMFAFSTIIGWSYYANRSICYLFGLKYVKWYMVIYVIAAFIGGIGIGDPIWLISDITNAMMAIPNIIVVILLSKVIGKETSKYVWHNNIDSD